MPLTAQKQKRLGAGHWRVLTSRRFGQTMDQHRAVFEKCPAPWIEMQDIEAISFEKATWIPLLVEKNVIAHGQHGQVGHRKEYRDFDSIIVPADVQHEF